MTLSIAIMLCHYARCRLVYLLYWVFMLNFIMLNVIMLNVIMLNVIMLNVIMLNVIMLNVIRPRVVAPSWLVYIKRFFQMFSFKIFRFKKTVLRNRWIMKDLSFNAKKLH